MSGKNIFIAKSADVLGKVRIGDYSSIWYQAVLRGDMDSITIGERSNVQDGSVVHVAPGGYCVKIGDGVTIGHNCTIHGCTIENNVLVGMGSTILNGAVIGENTIIGPLTDAEIESIRANAREYMECMRLEPGKSYYENSDGIIVVRQL